MASRAVTRNYPKLLPQMAVRSLLTFASSISNSGDIDLPESLYKSNKNVVFSMKQVMTKNTCNRLRRAFSSDSASDATEVESQGSDPIDPESKMASIGSDPIDPKSKMASIGIVHRAVFGHYIRTWMFPNFNAITSSRFYKRFYEQGLNKSLGERGLLQYGNVDLARPSQFKYITVIDFMWMRCRVPQGKRDSMYSNMLMEGICVLDKSIGSTLKHPVVVLNWIAPPKGWYKLNIEVFVNKETDGTIRGSAGGVLRNHLGIVATVHLISIPNLASRNEVLLVGICRILMEVLQHGTYVENIILEGSDKNVIEVLRRNKHVPQEYSQLYRDIFDLLALFNKHTVEFIYPTGNEVANRLAYSVIQPKVDLEYDKRYYQRLKDDIQKRIRFHVPGYCPKRLQFVDDPESLANMYENRYLEMAIGSLLT